MDKQTTARLNSCGPYQILTPLGAGGMGEVFRARDTRLQREVAVKVLSEEFAASPERRSRFEREARAVAALNHPNIVAVHDIGEEHGHLFMVTELVPGRTLRALLRDGPPPLRTTIELATQIAHGITAAHEAGITHRDLKPENIMITADGTVKILDFGLARQNESLQQLNQADRTMTVHETTPGVVMGTANYMSPEQARGAAVDYRSDQFSFGLIIYEMLAGIRPFERESTVQTMSALLTDEPPAITAKTPAPLRWIVERCLAKDPRQRYTSTRDLYQELRNLCEHLSELSAAPSDILPAVVAQRKVWRNLVWTGISGLVVLAALLGGIAMGDRTGGRENQRYTPFATSHEQVSNPLWSPDGQAVVYEAAVDGEPQVFLRYLNSPQVTQLTHGGKDGYAAAGWAADSRAIYVLGSNPTADKPPVAVFSLPIFGGEPELVMTMEYPYAWTVSPDGRTLAVGSYSNGVGTIWTSSPIGAPLKKYSPAPFDTTDSFNRPQLRFSPDGKKIIYCIDVPGSRQLWLLPFPAGSAAPRKLAGEMSRFGGTPWLSWLPDNRHLVVSLMRQPNDPFHLYLTDLDSLELAPVTGGVGHQMAPAVSPDGQKVVYAEATLDLNIVSASLSDASVSKLIATERAESMPAWSARQLVYVTERSGPQEIWLRAADNSERPLVTEASFAPGTTKWFMTPSLSPEGNRIVFVRVDSANRNRLWISSTSGSPPVRLTNAEAAEFGGAFSPDGGRFVYHQVAGSKDTLMVVRTTGQAIPTPIASSTESSALVLPDWSPDGEWISWHTGDGWFLISPDGKKTISLGKFDSRHLAFSRDSKELYGVRYEAPHNYLYSVDIASRRIKTIGDVGAENAPYSRLNPGIRFSLTPDGRSITYSVRIEKSSLWMLEGFRRPGLLNWFRSKW